MEYKTTFQKRINELYERARVKENMTKVDYANKLEITISTLKGWMTGNGQPSADKLVEISKKEKVPLEWLLTDGYTHEEYTSEEVLLIEMYRKLEANHKKDILAFLSYFYMKDIDV